MCGDTEINSSNLRAALNKLNKQGRDQTTNMATQFKVMLYTITEETPNNGHSWDPCSILSFVASLRGCPLLEVICFTFKFYHCIRYWISYLLNRVMPYALLHFSILTKTAPWNSCHVSIRTEATLGLHFNLNS